MFREGNVTGRKNAYPSKTVMNLYYKEDRTSRPSTIALYVLFALAVLLAAGKFAFYDPLMAMDAQRQALAEKEAALDEQLDYLKDYDEVSSQYSRYSYDYLREEEQIRDRMEVMDMLEATVFRASTIDTVAMRENSVSVSCYGLTLEETAALAREIEAYEFVLAVDVNTASLNTGSGVVTDGEVLTTTMVIQLDGGGESADAGGEQA